MSDKKTGLKQQAIPKQEPAAGKRAKRLQEPGKRKQARLERKPKGPSEL